MTKGEAIRIVEQWLSTSDEAGMKPPTPTVAIKRLLQEVKGNGRTNG